MKITAAACGAFRVEYATRVLHPRVAARRQRALLYYHIGSREKTGGNSGPSRTEREVRH